MHSRMFAFGCSYTNNKWLSLADLIGVNFEKYYNLGKPGCCNMFISNSVLLADEIYKFCETDYVLVGITGIRRFSFFNGKDYVVHGDIFPRPKNLNFPEAAYTEYWANHYENFAWAMKRTLASIKLIKFILSTKKVKFKIYKSIYDPILEENVRCLPNDQAFLYKEINQRLDIRMSIDELAIQNDKPFRYEFVDGDDGHPTIYQHYYYLKKYFPEFDTVNTHRIYRDYESIIDLASTFHAARQYNLWKKQHCQLIHDFENSPCL